jgi:hypothetical protein
MLIITVACSSDDDEPSPESQLPPITQTGENTFGCLIDGKLFVPRDGTGTFAGPDRGLRMLRYYDNIEFDAHDYKSHRTSKIYIHLEDAVNSDIGSHELVRSNGAEGLDGGGAISLIAVGGVKSIMVIRTISALMAQEVSSFSS